MPIIKQESIHTGTIDSEMLSEALLTRPEVFRHIVLERYGSSAPLQVIAELFSTVQNMSEGTYDQDLYTWGIMGTPILASQIVAISGTAKVGNEFELTLKKDAWFEQGAVLSLEDDRTQIFLVSDAVETTEGYLYRAQVKGNFGGWEVPSDLLAQGKYVNFVTTNYQEGSERGHRIPYSTPNKMVNAGFIHRTDIDGTGTAYTTGLLYEDVKIVEGQRKKWRGFLPMGLKDGKLHLDWHVMACEQGLMNSEGNFDPTTGTIYNSIGGKKVLSGFGFEQQLEVAEKMAYHPNDREADVAQKLTKFIVNRAVKEGADTLDHIIMGGTGLKMVLQNVFADLQVKSREQVFLNVGENKKVKVGLLMDELVTPKGSIKYVYNPYFDKEGQKLKKIMYKGVELNASSFRGYFMPIRQTTDASGRAIPTFQILNRAKNGINRSLVPGVIPGMTGMFHKIAGADKFAASYDAYTKVATGRDAETFMLLSEKMLVIHNPTEFGKIDVLY